MKNLLLITSIFYQSVFSIVWHKITTDLTQLWNEKTDYISGFLKSKHGINVDDYPDLLNLLNQDIGCWCQSNNRKNIIAHGTSDEFDIICKQYHKCIECSNLNYCNQGDDYTNNNILLRKINGHKSFIQLGDSSVNVDTGEINEVTVKTNLRCGTAYKCPHGYCVCFNYLVQSFAEIIANNINSIKLGNYPNRFPGSDQTCKSDKISGWTISGKGFNSGEEELNIQSPNSNNSEAPLINLQNNIDSDITVMSRYGLTGGLGITDDSFITNNEHLVLTPPPKLNEYSNDQCCGEAPLWVPFNSNNGVKQCCGANVYDTRYNLKCCNRILTSNQDCATSSMESDLFLNEDDILNVSKYNEKFSMNIDYEEIDNGMLSDWNSAEGGLNLEDEVIREITENLRNNRRYLTEDLDESPQYDVEPIWNSITCLAKDPAKVQRQFNSHLWMCNVLEKKASLLDSFDTLRQDKKFVYPDRSCKYYVDCNSKNIERCEDYEKFNGSFCDADFSDYQCGKLLNDMNFGMMFETKYDSTAITLNYQQKCTLSNNISEEAKNLYFGNFNENDKSGIYQTLANNIKQFCKEKCTCNGATCKGCSDINPLSDQQTNYCNEYCMYEPTAQLARERNLAKDYFCEHVKPSVSSFYLWTDWSCETYIHCSANGGVIKSCPEGEYYSTRHGRCFRNSGRDRLCDRYFKLENDVNRAYIPTWDNEKCIF